MPKRPNPFIDDFQPQLKIHVGSKEYRNTEDKMKSIYEKTIGILFEGANQKNNNNGVIDISETVPNSKGPENSLQNKTMKQMYFGKNGALQTNGGQIQLAEAPLQCPLCCQQPAEPWLSCGYCEGPQCSGCALLCASCSSATCANCSVDSFRGSSGIFCLSCCR